MLLQSLAVAVLVFFAAAAGTGVVASHFLFLPHDGLVAARLAGVLLGGVVGGCAVAGVVLLRAVAAVVLAAFLLGEAMCFYRYNVELFKKYFMLYYILLAVSCMVQSVSMVATAGGGVMIGLIGSIVYGILALVVSILNLVMRIRFGKNFNREYYNHCKQQMTQPASQRRAGTSAKKMWLFVLVVAVILGVWYAGTTLITQQVQKAYWGSFWDDGSYSEDTYTESSSYYDEADSFAEEEPSYTEDASSSEAFVSEYNLPVGTYQMWIGYGGTTASIRLWEEPSDPENPWYCDVIIWDGIDTIVDNYFGPAYVSDELQTIVCGDYTFGIGYDGSVLVDDSMSDVPYNVIYYSGDTSMETGLNALIDISDELTPVTKDAVDVYSEFYGLDRTIIHMPMD